MMKKVRVLLALASLATLALSCDTGHKGDQLDETMFANPPQSSHADTWWHWSGSNITRECIRKDLLAMHSLGIKRATVFDTAGYRLEEIPATEFGSPEWFDLFEYAVNLADSLGMTLGVHNCAGWATSGGPWITPEKSMKVYTWTKTYASGGESDISPLKPSCKMDYYEDYAVVAYPAVERESAFRSVLKSATCDGADVTRAISDGNAKSWAPVPPGGCVDIELKEPCTVSQLCLYEYRDFCKKIPVSVYTSTDGNSYSLLGRYEAEDDYRMITVPIRETTARFFRLEIHRPDAVNLAEVELLPKGASPSYHENQIGHLKRFLNVYRASGHDLDPCYASDAIPVDHRKVIDLTDRLRADGTLDWTAPDGDWCILRFGYTTGGYTPHPCMPGGQGLESDKLDKAATDYHFDSFVRKLVDRAGDQVGKGFSFILIDSWEARSPTWTGAFPDEFLKRNGYDIRPWLPALCDEVVESPEVTDRFVADYYGTIADLVDRNYYREMSDLSHAAGLEFHSEPMYGGAAGTVPPLDVIKSDLRCDLPMYEFSSFPDPVTRQPEYHPVDRTIAGFPVESIIYSDRNVVGAEAFTATAHFSETPQLVAPYASAAYCSGINQMILHTYVIQPMDSLVHLTLHDLWGGHYNRNTPWYRLSRGWFDYMARIQYVLQQGERVTDLLYYVGDQYPQDINNAFRGRVPKGYRPNIVNAECFSRAASYPMLVIPLEAEVGAETAAELEALKKKGVKVVYEKDSGIPLEAAPDFECDIPDEHFLYTHRHIGGDEAYFLFNQDNFDVKGGFTFRVSGKVAQIWDPETGEVFSARTCGATPDGRMRVELGFRPMQALFVVFKDSSDAPLESVETARSEVRNLRARLSFKPEYEDVIGDIETTELKSLTEYTDPSIRYFAGEVTYTLAFDLPEGMTPGENLAICFGGMPTTALVCLNGEPLRGIWHDGSIVRTDALKAEGNTLVVRVGTTMRNRICGDYELYGCLRSLRTPTPTDNLAKGDKDTVPSGLIGPVSIVRYE